MELSGEIFDTIKIVLRPIKEISIRTGSTVEKFDGREGYVATSKSSYETAVNWASEVNGVKADEPDVIELKNIPRGNYKILGPGFSVVNNSGCYKILSEEGWVLDISEESLLQAIKINGVKPGGYLNSNLFWAKKSSKLQMIVEDSEEHRLLIKATARGKNKKITVNQLIPGGVYITKGGDIGIFCGKVDTPNKKGQLLFVPSTSGTSEKHESIVKAAFNLQHKYNYCGGHIKSSISYIDKIDQISLPFSLREMTDIMSKITEKIVLQSIDNIHKYTKSSYYTYSKDDPNKSIGNTLKLYKDQLLISPAGEDSGNLSDEIKKYLHLMK